MNKEQRMQKYVPIQSFFKGLRKFFKMLLVVLGVLVLIFPLLWRGCIYYLKEDTTVLYKNTSCLGYDVEVLGVGHDLFCQSHWILIKINDQEMIKLFINMGNRTTVFPTENIICTIDNENQYKLLFDDGRGNGYTRGYQITFDANFTTVLSLHSEKIKCLNDELVIVE